ncbi:hypothetical protein [Tenacibaculum soleae]|nr:hypothetical protein [Tenacibaculum soleae]MDO6813081.1 hypothetical protein [Tenacibaculum soleae]
MKRKTFLLYNEEREMLNLTEETSNFLIRNQEILSISKKWIGLFTKKR